ncbi:uncharacterized protein LOC117327899 [Pecten maximus]|uniref:uncharacterized protein LOC117327899 n=1 Tax=Pecten maximus TaxID=6579 RepID=UPI0014589D01|nr:uncharacterized protein LOC117327899 [Pecten maximus]
MAEGSTEPMKRFVERRDVMAWLKEKYNTRPARGGPQDHQYRIYGVYGKKRVGKSCLMRKFLRQIQQDVSRNQKVHVGTFDFDKIRTFESFLNSLCKFYGVEMHKWRKSPNHSDNEEEDEEDYIECMSRIENKMNAEPSHKFIVFLDNLEKACGKAKKDGTPHDKDKDYLWDKIYKEIIRDLLKVNNFLVFITSTQTTKFAKLGTISCKIDMEEMDEKEAKCLLQNEVSGTKIDDKCLSAIVRLCDGLPPTIIQAGAMLREGDCTPDEIVALLKEFDSKMFMHSDDLHPKDDRYDAQLREYINRMSSENRKNLRSLAEMINKEEGKVVSIAEAATGLEFEANTAVFKLRFLLPLRFRGMVEVDRKTGLISMNSFFLQFVLEHIKGEKNVEGTPSAHSSTNGIGFSPPTSSHLDDGDDDDDDDDDAQSPTATHLIVPSHNSQDKASRLLEDTDVTGEAATQAPSVRDTTVISHHTQDSSSRLLSGEKSEPHLYHEENPEPNTAKMEGQYIGNRDEKPRYDITLTNQDSMESGNRSMKNNDLSPDHTRTSQWNITGCDTVKNKSTPPDVKSENNNDVKMLESNDSYQEDIAMGKKRSNTLEENTRITCKNQSGKGMHSLMSVEDNNLQPYKVSSHRSIPGKKMNQEASFEDNSLQDHDPELPDFTKTVSPVDTANNSLPDDKRFVSISHFDGVVLQSPRSTSTTTDMTEDDNCSETNEKMVYSSRTGHLSPDCQSLVTEGSRYEVVSQYNAMSYLGSTDFHTQDPSVDLGRTDFHTQDPSVEDQDDPLHSSFASDKLFASGQFKSSAFREISQDKTQYSDQCPPQAVRPRHKGQDGDSPERQCKPSAISQGVTQPDPTTTHNTTRSTTRSSVTPGQGDGISHNISQIHLTQTGVQELSPQGRGVDTAPLQDTRTGPSVESDSQSTPYSPIGSEISLHITGQVEPAELQERTGILASVTRFFSDTFQMLKEMES